MDAPEQPEKEPGSRKSGSAWSSGKTACLGASQVKAFPLLKTRLLRLEKACALEDGEVATLGEPHPKVPLKKAFSVKRRRPLSRGVRACCWDPHAVAEGFFLRRRVGLQGLKVGKAAGVLFIVTGSDEHGLVEPVVAKLLKGDGGCDRGENGNVCRENRKWPFTCAPVGLESAPSARFLTQFDGKPGGQLHLNKLPEFIKVLEGRDHLQNIQQPETKHVVTHETDGTEMAST